MILHSPLRVPRQMRRYPRLGFIPARRHGPIAPVLLASGTSSSADPTVSSTVTPTMANMPLLAAWAIFDNKTVGACTGMGVTWTLVRDAFQTPDTLTRLVVFRASGVAVPGALSLDLSSATAATSFMVVQVNNGNQATADGIVQSAMNSAAADSLTVTLAAFASANNGTIGFFTAADVSAGAIAIAPGAGFTELAEYAAAPHLRLQCQYNVGNDTSVDASVTAANDGMNGVAVEVAAFAP